MKKTILDSYISRLKIDPAGLKAFYSFDTGSGNYVFNNLYTVQEQILSGIPIADKYPGVLVGRTKTSFDPATSGSGIFSYQEAVRVGDVVDFYDWTFFINYGASNFANLGNNLATVLVSTSTSTGLNPASGFLFGINQANRPFFEYKNGGSSRVYTLNQELGPKNILSLSKNGEILELTYHDKQHQDNYRLNFQAQNFAESNTWFVGGPFFNDPLYTGVSGIVDDFLLFNSAMSPSLKDSFVNAFFVSGIIPSSISGVVEYVSTIESVTINPTGNIGTGVVSSGATLVQIPDITGALIDLYDIYDITGHITGETFEYITGAPSGRTVLVSIPEQIYFDYNYLSGYVKPLFVYKGSVTNNDLVEVYGYNTLISGINVDLQLRASAGSFRVPVALAHNNLNVYLTGLYQISGSGASNRYSQTSNTIYNSTWPKTSHVVADLISGSQAYYSFAGGTGTLVLTDASYSGKDMYLNGRKLTSGIHYTNAGSTYNILTIDNLESGLINFAPRRTDIYSMYTGSTGIKFSGILDEQLWLNGLRLDRGEEYLKTSAQSLRTGNSLTGFGVSIYSNDGSFFNV